MTQEQWTAVDQYIADRVISPDAALEAALQASSAAELPDIQVTPNQGKLLWMLAATLGAKNILEVGTLGAYSTIWLARALPGDGRLITLEADPKHFAVAAANVARAGLTDIVEIRLGAALDTLPQLAAEHRSPFDLTFIDADKEQTADYFEWAVRLSRPGSLIIVDNVIRKGAILDPNSTDSRVRGVQRFFDLVSRDARVSVTAIQTVGAKGYDGMAILRVV